jgi:hypothetical protein
MTIRQLKNISKAQYEAFLELTLCKHIRKKGGHEHYSRADLTRPITFSNHVDPIPEFIIKNALRELGLSKQDFFDILEHKLIVVEKHDKNAKCKKRYNLELPKKGE